MKLRSSGTVLLVLLIVQFSSADTLRILPLGNSITESITPHVSYRCWLWERLVSSGLVVDFVGSRTGVATTKIGADMAPSPCPVQGFDGDHEGHCGWRVDEILYGATPGKSHTYPGSISEWLRKYQAPDMVLLHLGTVDILQNQTPASTATELGYLIDTLRVHAPDITIFLAKLIPLGNNTNPKIVDLNNRIPALASQKNSTRSPVIVVDQYSGFDGLADTWDHIHPNESGTRKMAAKWAAAITSTLTSSPVDRSRYAPLPFEACATEPARMYDLYGRAVPTGTISAGRVHIVSSQQGSRVILQTTAPQ